MGSLWCLKWLSSTKNIAWCYPFECEVPNINTELRHMCRLKYIKIVSQEGSFNLNIIKINMQQLYAARVKCLWTQNLCSENTQKIVTVSITNTSQYRIWLSDFVFWMTKMVQPETEWRMKWGIWKKQIHTWISNAAKNYLSSQ